VESFDFNTPNTKSAMELLAKIAPERDASFVSPTAITSHGEKLHQYPGCDDRPCRQSAPYEILKSSYVVLTQDALNKVEEVFTHDHPRNIVIAPIITEKSGIQMHATTPTPSR
jgi:ribosomal protein L4